MKKIKEIGKLFLTMLKIGLFTFGGGYAMIALLDAEFVERRGWIERDEFLNMVAIAESTPGPIAINSSTYIGYKRAGIAGSLFATLGVVIPSFTIIFIISLFFDAFLSLTLVSYAFRGIQAAVIYLILSAGIKMLRELEKSPVSMALFTLTFVLMVAFSVYAVNFSSIFYILIGGTVGVFTFLGKHLCSRKASGGGEGE